MEKKTAHNSHWLNFIRAFLGLEPIILKMPFDKKVNIDPVQNSDITYTTLSGHRAVKTDRFPVGWNSDWTWKP